MDNNKKARVIAFYLPQFHPIPENDEWWGKGFTEWVNVAKAKPLFRGHYQPKIPADLGFYDLRLPIIREQQAQLAKNAGIEGFCYWHYWFGNGKQLLEKPFQEVLESGRPDYPFCLGWANEDWTNKSWKKKSEFIKDRILMKQTYSGKDYIKHFHHLLPAFRDKRYITVDEKPLFVIFRPLQIPNVKNFIELWENLAFENGLKGIHFVGIVSNFSFIKFDKTKTLKADTQESKKRYQHILDQGFDAVNSRGYHRAEIMVKGPLNRIFHVALRDLLKITMVDKYRFESINKHIYVEEDKEENIYPTIIPNWDRSPRSGRQAIIYTDSTPSVFDNQIKKCLDLVKDKNDEHKIVFLQSWNEWGEGNYVEPDIRYGHDYLNMLRNNLNMDK